MYSLKKIMNLVREDVSKQCVKKGMTFMPEDFENNLVKVIEKCLKEDKGLFNGLTDPEKKKEVIDTMVGKIIQKL